MAKLGRFFLGTIIPRKNMPSISAVGLFYYNKFEETPNEKVVNMSKLTKPYFRETTLFKYLFPTDNYEFRPQV